MTDTEHTEYAETTADDLVNLGFEELAEAEAAHYVSMLGAGRMVITDPNGQRVELTGGQARVHADFKAAMALAHFTAALTVGTEFEFDDDDPELMGDDPPTD